MFFLYMYRQHNNQAINDFCFKNIQILYRLWDNFDTLMLNDKEVNGGMTKMSFVETTVLEVFPLQVNIYMAIFS